MITRDTRTSVVIMVCGFIATLGLFILLGDSPKQASAALDNEPTRKAEIVIQYDKVGANLTDFPALLTKDNIPTEACDADGSSPAQNGGGDIRFTSDENGNNQLALEVIDFTTANDPANCTVEMYVKIPSLSSTANTSIWMWYNTPTTDSQPIASSAYGSENVWDSNYKGVWHLDETSSTRGDSTTNDNHLADNNTVGSGSGQWGTAADFERDNGEYFSIADASHTGLDVTGAMTLSFWAKRESTGAAHILMQKYVETGSQRSYSTNFRPDNDQLNFTVNNNGVNDTAVNSTTTFSTGTWYHIAAVYNPSSSLKIYVNGTQDAENTSSIPASLHNGSAPFHIGAASESPSSSNSMDGLIKDGRVSSTARSASWISTEYNNQSNPGTFAIEQAPEEATTAPASATVIKSSNENVSSSATLQDDDQLSFSLNANTEYVISGGIFATSTSTQPDIQIGFAVPSGATMDIGYLAQGGTARTAELLETSGSASARISIPANENAIIQPFGSVVTSTTGGTLNFKWSQFSSNATATTVKQGSFITVSEVTQ